MRNTGARSCGSKIRHLTREAALKHVARLVRAGASPQVLSVYRCKVKPRHWHVGHRIPNER